LWSAVAAINTEKTNTTKTNAVKLGAHPLLIYLLRDRILQISQAVLRRNQQIRELVEQGDKSCCILTRFNSIEVAHIYPYHSIKYKDEDIFGQRHIF
jgi:hypothetical protein